MNAWIDGWPDNSILRILCAETLGWTPRHHPAFDPLAPFGKPPGEGDGWERIPNFPVCYNAAQALRQGLTGAEKATFGEALASMLGHHNDYYEGWGVGPYDFFGFADATARQTCIAFLVAKGKQPTDQPVYSEKGVK